MLGIRKIRNIIKKEFPDLKFTMETVSFQDLARGETIFLDSFEWGICKGNRELFQKVQSFCEQFDNVIVSF